MRKIKSLPWTGICYTLLFIFNAGIVFFGILCSQTWFLITGILLSLFQCRLYSFKKLKPTAIQKLKDKQPAPVAVSFYHRPTGLDIRTADETGAGGHPKMAHTHLPSAN